MNPLLVEELSAILAAAPLPPAPALEIDLPPVDVSPRAKRMRAIMRIADSYGWHSAIVHFLEMKGVSYLSDLTNPQLEDLLDRMDGYVDAAETGCSLEYGLPAF